MDNSSIEVLLIEDNFDDAFLLKKKINSATSISAFNVVSVDRLSTGIEELKNNYYDIVLLDLSLPDSSGIESFQKLFNERIDIPIIVLTGLQDEETALKIVHLGAQDYLLKSNIDSSILVRAILYAIERYQTLQQLKREVNRRETAFDTINEIDFNLKELLIRYKNIINSVSEIIIETDDDDICISANSKSEVLFGKNVVGEKIILSDSNSLETKAIILDKDISLKNVFWKRKEISLDSTIKICNLYLGNIKS